MRPSLVRLARKVRVTAEPGNIFSVFHESTILKKILYAESSDAGFPYVESLAALNQLSGKRQHQQLQKKRLKLALQPNVVLPEPTANATKLMQQPAVSTKQVEQFLRQYYLSVKPPFDAREQLDKGLTDLISASTPNNLRTLMQFLAKYWQSGLEGSRPTISTARKLSRAVLSKSLVAHPPTEHAGGGEQVGIPDMHKFETFVTNFFTYMGVSRAPGDELDDLLLRLCARCGPLETATNLITNMPNTSEETMQCYLAALASTNPSAESLSSIKQLLINDQTGPAAVRFLIPVANSLAEIYQLLVLVDRSALRLEVYEQCQTDIVKRVLDFDPEGTTLFPLLQRLRPLNRRTLEVANLVCNKSAREQLKRLA